MPSSSTIDFPRIFKTRRAYCRSLLDLSREQFELVENSEYARLLELLGRKQRLLGRLDELHQTEQDLWGQWKEARNGLEPSVRHQCEQLLRESENLLAEVLIQEKAGTDALSERRNGTQRQLLAISRGTKVSEAYRDNLAPATNRHLDIDQ